MNTGAKTTNRWMIGPGRPSPDREEARTHAADVVAVVSAQPDLAQFKAAFERQFESNQSLGMRVSQILINYFREDSSPGLLVYEEFLSADKPALDREARREVVREIERAHALMSSLSLP
jgi:hypothetical protein